MRLSHLNVPFFQHYEFIYNYSPRGGSSNYRPSAPFLYGIASHVKNCHFDDFDDFDDYREGSSLQSAKCNLQSSMLKPYKAHGRSYWAFR